MDKSPHRKRVQHFNVPGHAILPTFALGDKPPVAHKQDSSFINHLSLSSHIHFMTAPRIADSTTSGLTGIINKAIIPL